MSTIYEWDNETIDENGEVLDHFTANSIYRIWKLDGLKALVRDTDTYRGSGQKRLWAYVNDNKLPEFFSDAENRETDVKVPKRFHEELRKCLTESGLVVD